MRFTTLSDKKKGKENQYIFIMYIFRDSLLQPKKKKLSFNTKLCDACGLKQINFLSYILSDNGWQPTVYVESDRMVLLYLVLQWPIQDNQRLASCTMYLELLLIHSRQDTHLNALNSCLFSHKNLLE